MVFFHHIFVTTVADGAWPAGIALLRRICVYGNTGVDVFFVLSGFLITSILLGDRRRHSYYAPFYWKRVLRIVPVYVLVLGYIVFSLHPSGIAVVCAALFVANFSAFFHVSPIMPFWSLAIEEQFYLVWPTLVHRKDPATLKRWAIGICLTVIFTRLIFAHFGHYNYVLTFLHCDGLAFGALLACLYVQRPEGSRTIWNLLLASWGLGATLVVAAAHMPVSALVERAYMTAVGVNGVTLLCTALVGTLVFATGARLLWVFRSAPLIFFGLISYCFYLVHLYVLKWYDEHVGVPEAPAAGMLFLRFGAVLAVTVFISLVSRYIVELPAQRLRRFIPVLNGSRR